MKRWKLYFAYAHLPPHLQAVSKPFHDLAVAVVNGEPTIKHKRACRQALNSAIDREMAQDSREWMEDAFPVDDATTLWCIIHAKDAAVRAHIPDPPEPDAG